MVDQLTFIINQYPILAHVLAGMAIARMLFKPIFAILQKYFELTVEEDDNNKLKKFMKTKTYKMLAFLVDYFSSAKLPMIKKK